MAGQIITKSLVDRLKSKNREYAVWDARLPGFGVRIRPSGAKSFTVVYRAGAGRGAPSRRFTIGAVGKITADGARKRAKEILGAVTYGRDPAADRAGERSMVTVAELADQFLEEHARKKLKESTVEFYEAMINKLIKPAFGTTKADKLSHPAVSKFHGAQTDRPVQANRSVKLLSGIYSFAQRQLILPKGSNPAAGVVFFPETARERFLTAEELNRLAIALHEAETVGLPWQVDENKPKAKHIPKKNRLTKIDKFVAAAFRLLIFTGCRLREILHLRWEYVDFERGALFLPDSKSGKKTIVLNTPATAILCSLERVGPYVIPGAKPNKPRADLKKPWKAVLKGAKLEGLRQHDLRHTFASVGVGDGLGLPIIAKLLGHAHIKTTQRYAHLELNPVRIASDKIGTRISDAMAITKQPNASNGGPLIPNAADDQS